MKAIKFTMLAAILWSVTNAQTINFQWAKQIGGSLNDNGNSIALDSSGNVYTTGYFRGTANFDSGVNTTTLTSAGLEDVYISKLNETGDFIWTKQIGGTLKDVGYVIALDSSENIYTMGTFKGTVDFDPGVNTTTITSTNVEDVFILKLNASGNFVWARHFNVGTSMTVDDSGNVYITGFFQGTADFDPGINTASLTSTGDADIFVSKLNPSGNFVWVKQMGGIALDRANSIAVDASGNIVITGWFNDSGDFDPGVNTATLTSTAFDDAFILKLDNSGNFMWARQMGGASIDNAMSITVDNIGNVYTTGLFASTVDFDPGINTFTLTAAGGVDIFISKLSASGNFVWTKQMGGIADDSPNYIAIDDSGNVYTTGSFASVVDFDPGINTSYLTPVGSSDIFVSKLDSSGNFVWAKRMGGTSFEAGSSLAIGDSGNVFTTGYFKGTTDFDPGSGTFNLVSTFTASTTDAFVHKMGPGINTTGINDSQILNTISLFPNPSNGEVNLLFENKINKATLQLINTIGQILMKKTNFSGDRFVFNISEQQSGIYFIEVNDGGNISRIKLVKN